MRIIGLLLLIVGGLYVVLLCFLYFYQSGLIFFPAGVVHTTPERVGLTYEDLTLDAEGTPIHAWWIPADSSGAPVVLFCHGNAGNVADRLDFLEHIHGSGLAVLIFDYAGYGRSGGRPSETQTYADVEAAYRWLRKRGYGDEDIILYGRSLGAAVAAHLAQDKKHRALVLEAAFPSLADMAAHHYPWAPVRLLLKYEYATADYVRRTRSPVFVIASPQDEIAPWHLARQLYEQAPEPRWFIRTEGRHNTLLHVDWAAILRATSDEKSEPGAG